MIACPCTPRVLPSGRGSGWVYAACCGRLHSGAEIAASAEALMRSRYSAYVLRLEEYLLATWHPDTRPSELDLTADDTKWLGLEVKKH
ncbi:MAG TPA: YchJ family metal-binding protein, partial [Azonexus sp.]|nr:YchJ family metal-binding protein [Azonexus sp.]